MRSEVRKMSSEEGLSFARLEDGAVRIEKKNRNGSTEVVTLEKEAWCSVISTMSKGGEIDNRFAAAMDFHDSEREIRIEKV